ncbi:unnamed protein product [Arctia plantaginis]|uniref:Gem-associated protein 8 n=1 Tax=Arctia plantaginis TaxID=874455 RepID=A0A8S0ZX31_ARCPL|nr:unnamed protein product [Arctia plantaginis]
MFSVNSQIPDDQACKSLNKKPRRQRRKLLKNKRKGNKRKNNKKNSAQALFPTVTMSSWAENFTYAATWQLKQQIAYWKSKATALQYENQLLHDIIRKNYINGSQSETSIGNETDTGDITETVDECQISEDEEEFEVSEEFIQFLMQNAKYKEEARLERERLKALQNTEHNLIKEMEAMPTKSTEDKEKALQSLYGENWRRIAALETSLSSQFISNCDLDKPEYWPNIPFNFNFN